MTNKIVTLFIISLFISSCNDAPLVASENSFSHKDLGSCDTVECPEIFIDYPQFSGEEAVVNTINTAVENFIISALYLDDSEENPSAKTISEAAQQFIDIYWTHHAEFPDLSIDYYAEIEIEESFRSEDIISLQMYQHKYVGGAHGYSSLSFGNFNTKTGVKITNDQLFKNPETFTKTAENYFRKQHNISENKAINATGFWFDDDTFYLPEGIGFTTTNLVIHYNQYEIASYAEGPIEVEIPLSEIRDDLNVSIEK